MPETLPSAGPWRHRYSTRRCHPDLCSPGRRNRPMTVTSALVGRRAELQALEDALAHLDRRRANAVELVGPAGIGKTRLLGELRRRAEAHGYLVLSGSGAELERELPFWVFVDALDEYLEGLDPRRLEWLDPRTRS